MLPLLALLGSATSTASAPWTPPRLRSRADPSGSWLSYARFDAAAGATNPIATYTRSIIHPYADACMACMMHACFRHSRTLIHSRTQSARSTTRCSRRHSSREHHGGRPSPTPAFSCALVHAGQHIHSLTPCTALRCIHCTTLHCTF